MLKYARTSRTPEPQEKRFTVTASGQVLISGEDKALSISEAANLGYGVAAAHAQYLLGMAEN